MNETTLKVNKLARRNRQLKVFSKANLLRSSLSSFYRSHLAPTAVLGKLPFLKKVKSVLSSAKGFVTDVLPISPKNRLLFQAGSLAVAMMVVTSFSQGGSFVATSQIYTSDYIDSYAIPGNVLVTDESGYLVKINPQTGNSNRIGLTDFAVHTVESGETLSQIASRYGVSVKTIMWENNLYNANSLRIGQKVVVPPVDGVSYKVASGDSLEKIASKYEISAESIIAQNTLESDVLRKGQKIFLPGAEPLNVVAATGSTSRNSVVSRNTRTFTAENSSSTPAVGKSFIFPTLGKITQGYHSGHYALDIADRSMPAVWSASSGTVTKASTGTWGGGYGNHVIVDHGDGVQTLYAHLNSVNVFEGQVVSQGEVLGQMGNTGRVYGATGIHLHWEVIVNGVKHNPNNYY